ncbi:MlaC/ttg2D family ABC transporter substrate-binding protein [Telmatospirillum siberiense]|uniref:Toluene tolerance protein n=1 Tax=Telmatospirillum siberiense TaxID=382514 RepID=A0A2N3PRI4_9PROT|nr:ABC transporter substrate-binding protein [Telmatospirillum siberiense]PKU23013.1 hypothetical protein CWS72_18405 [Telmatospirillum siberiense]
MRTRYLVYGVTALLLGSIALPCLADDAPTGQSAFVSELARKAILSVTSDTISSNDRQQRLSVFLDSDFDMPRIARFVLGRYWKKASESEQQTFIVVYRDFMARVYSQRFARYNGESFRVVGQHKDTEDASIVLTEMNQPAAGSPLRVEWRVADNGGYRIIDISVAGISMALAQREEFASYLTQNGGNLSDLISQLQVKIIALDSR